MFELVAHAVRARLRSTLIWAISVGLVAGLTLASFAVAYVLREAIVPGFPRTLHFLASETAATFAVMLGGGVVASLMAIWHALRTPPQLALGG